jgi:hypothetical protein
LYPEDTLLERLAQHFEYVAAELGSSSRQRTPWCASDTSPGIDT